MCTVHSGKYPLYWKDQSVSIISYSNLIATKSFNYKHVLLVPISHIIRLVTLLLVTLTLPITSLWNLFFKCANYCEPKSINRKHNLCNTHATSIFKDQNVAKHLSYLHDKYIFSPFKNPTHLFTMEIIWP